MENDSDKILSGNSVRSYEIDDEDEKGKEEIASFLYDFSSIINDIGTEDFKTTYLISKNDIRSQLFISQKEFCVSVLDKIEEVYEFKFPYNISIDNQEDIDKIYNFLEFIEYDNIDFFSILWEFIGIDLKDINIEEYCLKNISKLISEIEEISEISSINEMVTIFLRTYNKNDMVKFVISNTEKNKMEIKLRILQRRI